MKKEQNRLKDNYIYNLQSIYKFQWIDKNKITKEFPYKFIK